MIKRFLQRIVNWLFSRFGKTYPIGYWVAISRSLAGATIELLPKQGTPLAMGSATVRVPCDTVIFPNVAAKNSWQASETDMIASCIKPDVCYTLVDIGANIGLFSRQLLAKAPCIHEAHCYEPEAGNFVSLEHNLQPFGGRVKLYNRAIASTSERKELFIDLENTGNYSLTNSAMPGQNYATVVIETISVAEVEKMLVATLADRRIVWKSDTQGYDLAIACGFSGEFWARVDIALLEMWRIKGPGFDETRFAGLVEGFSRRCFVSNPATNLSAARILDFVGSSDGKAEDLLLVR